MTQHSTSPIGAGMNVHQSLITAAIVRESQETTPEVVHLPGDLNAVRKLFRRLAEQGAPRSCL